MFSAKTVYLSYALYLLQDKFGKSYSFEPLQRAEGGIEVTKWPGQNLNMRANGLYEQEKSLCFVSPEGNNWPLSVENEWKTNWKNNKDIVVNKTRFLPEMRFKSLNVNYTKKEMKLIRKCVNELDMVMIKKFIQK